MITSARLNTVHVGITNFTLLHSGWEANFKNPCKSASCSISDGSTADSVTCWVLVLVDRRVLLKKPPPSLVVR